MNTELYNTLSSKTTEELKTYITKMTDGYTEAGVSAAIAILRERGEDIDDLLREAQVAVCATCQHRSQSVDGLLCGKTGRKADFLCSCPEYTCDEAAKSEQDQNRADQQEWGGMMKFYWAILGIGACWSLFYNLQEMDFSNVFAGLGDLFFALAYAGLCVYTIVAFYKRMPNAVSLGKIQCYTLLVMNILTLLFGLGDGEEADVMNSPYRLIASSIWTIVFLVYLYVDKQIKAVYPKEERHMLRWDKPLLWGSLAIFFGLVAASIVYEKTQRADNELAAYVASYLGEEDEDTHFLGAKVEKDAVVINMQSDAYSTDDFTEQMKVYHPIFVKEINLLIDDMLDAELVEKCVAADMGLTYNWFDRDGNFAYEVAFSTSELSIANSPAIYKTPLSTWRTFISAWNEQLPEALLWEDLMCTDTDVTEDEAILFVSFVDIDSDGLNIMTEETLKASLLNNTSNLSSHFTILAMLNRLDIRFRFTCDTDPSWIRMVTITAEEYYEE